MFDYFLWLLMPWIKSLENSRFNANWVINIIRLKGLLIALLVSFPVIFLISPRVYKLAAIVLIHSKIQISRNVIRLKNLV